MPRVSSHTENITKTSHQKTENRTETSRELASVFWLTKMKKMEKTIDYKQQLERLKKILENYHVDNCMTNTFSDFESGHKKATLSISKDMIVLIKRALKGKLEDVGEPEIVKRVITNISKAEKMLNKKGGINSSQP